MAAIVSPFVIQNVTLTGSSSSTSTIFDDVRVAKSRLLEIRRVAKRRLDSSTVYSRPSQQAAPAGSDSSHRNRIVRDMLIAETRLEEAKGVRAALERRKEELRETTFNLRAQLNALKSVSVSDPDSVDDTVMTILQENNPSSTPDESIDDLSTVVCPFELMGECTDPVCRYMHLNR